MSHFRVYVFSNNDGEDVDDMLAPYDENIEMEPYVCLTREQAIAKTRKEIEDYQNSDIWKEWARDPETYKKKVRNNAFNEEIYNDHIDYLENKFPKMMNWTDEECYEYQKKFYNEDSIDVNGNFLSTYNPKSKWDWYEVGGRWKHSLVGKDGMHNDESYMRNIDWEQTPKPFAFITPDGEWHEKGEMGWWAIVTNEKDVDEWNKEFFKLVETLDDNLLVTVVDCHI